MAKRTNWTPEEIKDSLWNSIVLERAILNMYARQTPLERATESTCVSNGVGWSAAHARFMSSLAEQIKREVGRKEGEKLSVRQRLAAYRIMVKYTKQLARMANGEI